MKKVLFAYASESIVIPGRVNTLHADLAGNVEFIGEGAVGHDGEVENTQWILRQVKDADFVVIFFAAANGPSGTMEAQPGPPAGKTVAGSGNGHLGILDLNNRARLPQGPAVMVAIVEKVDREKLPADLKDFPVFDLSSQDSRDALLCRLVHEPVRSRPRTDDKKREGAAALIKVIGGAIATMIGVSDKVKDSLLNFLGQGGSQAVHLIMTAIVTGMFFVGVLAVLRLCVSLVQPTLVDNALLGLPGRPGFWRKFIILVAMLISSGLAVFLICHTPQTDRNLRKHLQEWTTQMQKSQRPNGGIADNAESNKGRAQVWSSSQCLAALLSPGSGSMLARDDAQRTFRFIDQTRIANLTVVPERRAALTNGLHELAKRGDFSKLPNAFPTFTMAVTTINRIGDNSVTVPEIVSWLEPKRAEYFRSGDLEEGWGYFEMFDWGVTEVAAWVAIAQIQSLRSTNPVVWMTTNQIEAVHSSVRGIAELLRARQIPSVGAFSPIKDTSDPSYARTYSTVMAIWALAEADSPELKIFDPKQRAELEPTLVAAVKWLVNTAITYKDRPKGWLVNPETPVGENVFLGLTAQTLCAIGRAPISIDSQSKKKLTELKRDLLQDAERWARRPLVPNDRMHDSDCYLYPTPKTIELSTFLWYPWSVALLRSFETDPALDKSERRMATKSLQRMSARAGEFDKSMEGKWNYVAAETVIGFCWPMDVRNE